MPRHTIRSAAAPQPEPVAYIHRQGNYWETSERHLTDDEKARGWTEEPLYTAPPQRAEPVQEPVAWRFQSAVGGWAYGSQPPLGSKYPSYPLYAAPPAAPSGEEEK